MNKYAFIYLGLAILILWQGLLPGYIFGLDMVFGPDMSLVVNADGFSNGIIVNTLIYVASMLVPAWIVQKGILVLLFFVIGYMAFKYMPMGNSTEGRLFSSLVYLANPFVYSRFLAGQWTHLMGYAFFPFFFHYLLKMKEEPDLNNTLKLFFSIFLISLFSIHYFVMVVMILGIYVIYAFADKAIRKNYDGVKGLFANLLISSALLMIIINYWVVPAIDRDKPIEKRLSESHWTAFSAGEYKEVDIMLNLASLNGFWGERNPWAKYFAWPQDSNLFWTAFYILAVMMLIGLSIKIKNAESRAMAMTFSLIAGASFVFATGAGNTVFRDLNMWMFSNVPFWSGFRDTHKFIGLLAMCYAVFAGWGLVVISEFLKGKSKLVFNMFVSVIFIVPVMFGYLIWGGFNKQIQAVDYPASWAEAKMVLDKDKEGKVLFLPWHLYLSLDFNNKVITANPARRFFGERIISSKSVELGDIRIQESDLNYIKLDSLVIDPAMNNEERYRSMKEEFGIKYIVKISDLDGVDNIHYGFLEDEGLELVHEGDGIKVYAIKG
ncbi:MAG: hypothetical protein BWY21_01386 [Parcubacteria group bacterium ADurb.Bin216]|nr:MAG: hypothetical protein BWY21_01386 [Parcubacteria group bacterium ADurb.Bin216]